MVSPSTPVGAPTEPPVPGGSVPGVVAAVVAAPTSPDLPDVLASLAAQDYPALQVVVVVTSADEAVIDAHRRTATEIDPSVHVVGVGEVGFARAANQVLRLVDGDRGLFLLLHDDVALAPDAVRQMVDEMFRSNAGVLGPKLVHWDEPTRLSSVGFDVDRFGELDDGLEPFELDQEQHDATGDKFALSTACLLIRADLFRRLDGFEPSHRYHGESLDLCWRAHIAGARVVIVPAAVARHRGRLVSRLAEPPSETEIERGRLATVASSTGGARLVVVVPLLLVLAVATALVALLRGRPRVAAARLLAPLGLVTGLGRILVRRRRIAALRAVPDREVADLQVRGSVRWNRFRRGRSRSTESTDGPVERDRSPLSIAVWSILLVLLVMGGRHVIADGVRPIGEILPFPDSPLDTLRSHLSGWWDRGLGETTAQPTGSLLVAVVGVIAFAQMGLLQTVGVFGALILGWLGVRRSIPGRAGLVATVVYAAVPLPYAAIASGRLAVLVAYAALPWSVLFARRAADVVDATVERRSSHVARLTLVVAVAAAFSPAAALVVLLAVVVVAVASGLAGDSWTHTLTTGAAAIVAFTGTVVLHLPWSLQFFDADGWDAVVGSPDRVADDRGLWSLLRFDVGPAALGSLIVVVYATMIVGLFVARSTRLIGAFSAVMVSVVFLIAAVAADQGASWLPEVGVLLAPVGFGLALGAGTLFASFHLDVRGGRFGLRQPSSLIALAGLVVGVVPAMAVAVDGRWEQPSTSFVSQLDELLVDPAADGDYRVLVIGDPELVPGADRFFDEGIAYSLVRAGRFGLDETWPSTGDLEERVMGDVLTAMAGRSTARAGRLMAPFGVRYVVVPTIDRVRSTSEDPLPLPEGLIDALREQLDLRAVYSPATMAVFENQQWIPITAMLGTEAAAASGQGGASALSRTEVGDSRPVATGTTAWRSPASRVDPGLLHLGVPFDDRWSARVDGRSIDGEGSFGSVMSFAVDRPGAVSLHYDRPSSRWLWSIVQVGTWVGVVVAVRARRRRREPELAPIIRWDAEKGVE